jgi:hypothetical protein
MDAEQLKHKIKEILGEKIVFNKEFDRYAENVKNIEPNLVEWCLKLKNKEVTFEPAPNMRGCIVFIKRIGSSNRCIVIKIVNSEFKEFHLANHAYYDKLRKQLGLKQDNKYY